MKKVIFLSILAAGGVVATGYFSARAARIVDEKGSRAPYILPIVIGGGTIVCMAGALYLGAKESAGLSSAYSLLAGTYQAYTGKVKEKYGLEAHKEILDSIAAEKSSPPYLYFDDWIGDSTLDFEDYSEEDERLFYDVYSKRYFTSTKEQVLQAEYHLNRNFTLGGSNTVNELYEFLGIGTIEDGDNVGWDRASGIEWVDFDHSKTVLDDGLECLVIDMVFTPEDLRMYEGC